MFKVIVACSGVFVIMAVASLNLIPLPLIKDITKIFENGVQNSFATTDLRTSNNLLPYENSTLGISIQYPSNWLKSEAKNGVIFQSSQQNTSDIFREQVGISVTSSPSSSDNASAKSSLSLAQSSQDISSQLLNQEINQLKSSFPGFQLIQSLPTTIANGTSPAQMIVYSYKDNTVGTLKTMKIIAVQGANLYKISYFAQPDKYDIYLPVVQTMVDSLKILNLHPAENVSATVEKTLSASPVLPPPSSFVPPPSASPSASFGTPSNQTVLNQQQSMPSSLQQPPFTSDPSTGQQQVEQPSPTVPNFLFPPQGQQTSPVEQSTQPSGSIRPSLTTPRTEVRANGTIDSLIFAPGTRWIATGNWTLVLGNGNVTSFSTNMTWYNNNGTGTHTHELLNFKPSVGPGGITVNPGDDLSMKGLIDVGTNHRIVWQNVHSTIDIKGAKTISISLDDKETNKHFAGQAIYGIVKSFTRCSDEPGPNMEVLPICTT